MSVAAQLPTERPDLWSVRVTPTVVEAVIADPDAWDYIAKAAHTQRDTHQFGTHGWSLLNRLFLIASEIAELGACAQPVHDTPRPSTTGTRTDATPTVRSVANRR